MNTPDCMNFEMTMRVRDYEVDSQGIVNNANYLHYMEHTRHEFCRHWGTTFRQMQEAGIDPVVSSINIRYRAPLGLGDEMVSRLRLYREGIRFVFHQAVFRASDMALCAEADITVVCLEHGRLTRGEVLAEAFANYFNQ